MRDPASARAACAALALGAAMLAPDARASWLDEAPRLVTFRLDDREATRLPLLDAFRDAAIDPSSERRRYFAGQWGRWRAEAWWPLAWQSARRDDVDDATIAAPRAEGARFAERLFGFESQPGSALALAPETAPAWIDPSFTTPVLKTSAATFASNGFDALWSLPPSRPIPNWRCRRRPVRIARYGGESDMFPLVRCDGSVAPEALDRLTLMARMTETPRPGELLPDEPDPASVARGEWAPGVRLVHARLLWVIQRVADAFPWRTIYVFSGYRRDPDGAPVKPGTHHSMHAEARAMDISVTGVPNAAIFQLCRTLDDVGCGFYPNSKFVHVDVRRPGTGHAYWIDASGPGEPSRYVDSWPGVVEGGALVWDPGARRGEANGPGAEASCTRRGGP
jgi:hypothetical protein